jgi:hypothetical protein
MSAAASAVVAAAAAAAVAPAVILQVMVEKLTPERLSHEFSLGPDAPQVAFRALRQEWVDMGYGVAPESVKQRRGLAPDM